MKQALMDSSIALTTDSFINCLCDRHEAVIIHRNKINWKVWIDTMEHFDARGETIFDALLELMVLLESENEKTIEDYKYNYELNN